MKSYTELSSINSFKDRVDYLLTKSKVGDQTFGAERYLNQSFYRGDPEWRSVRDKVMIRDSHDGCVCDLGCPDHPIIDEPIVVHHINPVTIEDVLTRSKSLLDPDNLVCTTDQTHRVIHYGNANSLPKEYVPRRPNDTIPWR